MSAPAAEAGSFWDQFRDEDGWFDASDYVLNNAIGFMPVPIIITEPAVGEGLGIAALFFHPPKGYDQEEFERSDAEAEDGPAEFVLPDITAAVGAVTNNGTWMVGGAHFAHWKNDTVRYEGVIGYANVNLRFYGLNSENLLALDDGIEFTGEGVFIDQPFSWRMGKSDFFLGAEYLYSNIETRSDFGQQIPGFPQLRFDAQLSAVGTFLRYDSRDTIFTPNSGTDAKLKLMRYDDAIGSDFDYTQITAFAHHYMPLGEKWVLGLRGKMDTVSGDVPFYAVPFIDMRGIPALRFQGEATALMEAEARWAFHPRISAVGFAGVGKAAESYGDFSDAPSRVVRGLGIRYFMARKLGMHAGIDVAKGPDDTFWYLTVGGAWR